MKRFLSISLSVFLILVFITGCSWFKKKERQTLESDTGTQEQAKSQRQEAPVIAPQDIDLSQLTDLQEDVDSANSSVSDAQSVENSLDEADSVSSQ